MDLGGAVTPPVHYGGPRLANLGHFGPLLRFSFFGGKPPPFLHDFLDLGILFSLLVSKVGLRGLERWRSGGFGLNGHLGCITPHVDLQKLQETNLSLAL